MRNFLWRWIILSFLIKTAFEKVMTNLESQINGITYEFNTTVAVPANIFTFTAKSIVVPAGAFDVSAVSGAQATLNRLVGQINSYSEKPEEVSRTAVAARVRSFSTDWRPAWQTEVEDWKDQQNVGIPRELAYDVPSVLVNGKRSSSSSMRSPASRSASNGGESSGVIVNIFDGTGQKISAYDSSIRVQITERASRNSHFAALE